MATRGLAAILTAALLCSAVACSSDSGSGSEHAVPQQVKPVS